MVSTLLTAIAERDGVNYLVTNHIPRRLATRFMGWFSRIEQPLVRDVSLAIWRAAAGDSLRLDEAERTEFRSIHDCFTRALKPGARPIDADPAALVSPCDGIVVGAGRIDGATLVQAKGFTYTLDDLLQDAALSARLRDGRYVTLRLTSTMYHRFHAPDDGRVTAVCHVPGDAWNVNPPALARVPRLYCRNERVVIPMTLDRLEAPLVLVAVGAILVGSVHLQGADLASARDRTTASWMPCDVRVSRGAELGYFHHGSTIIVLAPPGLSLDPRIALGTRVRMGESLVRRGRPPGSQAVVGSVSSRWAPIA